MTDSVVDLFTPESTNILDEGGDLCRAAEEDEHLVDRVRGEVVCETVCFERQVFPGSLELQAEAIKPKVNEVGRWS